MPAIVYSAPAPNETVCRTTALRVSGVFGAACCCMAPKMAYLRLVDVGLFKVAHRVFLSLLHANS